MEFVSYDIASMDFRRAGAASRSIKERLKLIGADAEAIRRTMIAAYEAEMNVVIHSVGGRLEASLSDSQIDVNVVDEGPGIPDVDLAMVEGFSTASAEVRTLGFGAGMGLPNIKRNSDRLRITSHLGEGTRVSFTVYLAPERTDGSRVISLYASADRCRECRACLTACPTQAMRVREGRPSVLEHLCIDCADCVAACRTRALSIRDEISSLHDLADKEKMLLVVPPALLASCGPDYSSAQVLSALRDLGFADVISSEPYEQALRDAAVALAGGAAANGLRAAAGATTPARAPRLAPVIVPSCPAIVSLIELRFPSLVPHLAPFDSPWEAVQAIHGDRPVAYVVSCPSQRSALLAHADADGARAATDGAGAPDPPQVEYVAPEVVRQAVMVKLTGGDLGRTGAARSGATPAGVAAITAEAGIASVNVAATTAPPMPTGPDRPLTVTGTAHVIAVLEKIEDGLLADVSAVDPYACEGGCFGSPLLVEDYHVAARRWAEGRAAVEAAVHPRPAATPRRRPFIARPGIRLDADMGRAIEKLGRLQAVIESLPGKDCGACGAPTCAALAEDVVMERACVGLCPYTPDKGKKEDRDR
jgi:anti-sigma regulatory factor (Ser/Thr protein kinase)